MKKALLSLLLAASLFTASCGTVVAAASLTGSPKIPEGADTIDAAYDGIVNFGARYTAEALKAAEAGTNVVVSPLSAYIALAMCREGAAGDTRAELDALLGDVTGEQILSLMAYLTSRERTDLSIANSVWVDKGATPKEAFLGSMGDSYCAEVYNTKLAAAAGEINAWIEDKTDGKITDMLKDDMLSDALLVLVNAICLEAQWKTEFDANSTRKWLFHNADGSVTETDFMFAKGTRRVIETSDYLGVVLPYSDDALEFVAIMPKNDLTTTAELAAILNEDGGFAAVTADFKNESVKLSLPKFEQEYAVELNDVLMTLGLDVSFSDFADFSEMCEPAVKIGKVIQNAVVKVDEKGTTAAAATAVIMVKTTAARPEESREITFDRPFVFAVYDSASGTVLFSGARNTAK